jgi:hypothetical protein
VIVMNHGRHRHIRVAVLIIVALVAAVAGCSSPHQAPAAARSSDVPRGPIVNFRTLPQFRTLPPGAQLPSAAYCARRVRATASPEIVPDNKTYNRTVGQKVGPGLFPAGDSAAASLLAPLISGDFTGTTQQILEWAACKWGISSDIVFAQAAAESTWQQNDLGDFTSDPAQCPPGYGLGTGGVPGQCPESVGILQTKYTQWKAAWPGIANSTAMNADVTYAIWRSCFNGDEIWLRNSAPPGHPYQAGDLWGCVGRWFAGNWYSPAAEQYIDRIQTLMQDKVWEEPGYGLSS